MGSEGHGEVGTGEATCRYGRGGELLARGGWPVGRRQVALEGLAGAGIRGEEVGGGWLMIGARILRRKEKAKNGMWVCLNRVGARVWWV